MRIITKIIIEPALAAHSSPCIQISRTATCPLPWQPEPCLQRQNSPGWVYIGVQTLKACLVVGPLSWVLFPTELAIVPFLCFSSFFSPRCIVFWIKFCSSILHVLLNPLTISLVVMICFTRSCQVRYIAMLLPSFPNGFIYISSLSCKCLVDKVPYYDINLYFEFGIFKFIWSQLF